jgi:hypothetical protein
MKYAFSAALFCLLLSAPARAQDIGSHDIEVVITIVCDTQHEVERFVALMRGKARSANSAVSTINAEIGISARRHPRHGADQGQDLRDCRNPECSLAKVAALGRSKLSGGRGPQARPASPSGDSPAPGAPWPYGLTGWPWRLAGSRSTQNKYQSGSPGNGLGAKRSSWS